MVEGKLTPMAEVHGFWSEAIHAGVRALGFQLGEVAGQPWMIATIAKEDIPGAVRRAAAAAIEVDKEIAHQAKLTLMTQARAALMSRLSTSPASVELENYQRVLAVAVLQRVAPDPARLLKALADPYA
ncbi:hypothetical protein [Caulobacter segnis]